MESTSAIRQQAIRDYLECHSASSQQISSAAMSLWLRLSRPLDRMIGATGVTSLFDRCVDLNQKVYVWFPRSSQTLPDVGIFAAVWHSLSEQDTAAALAASIELFSTFFELLAMLIGERLTAKVFHLGFPDDANK